MTTVLKKPLLVALAGFGKVAELAHLPALQAGSGMRLTAVAEPVAERRELAGRLLPEARLYGDLAELLAAESGLGAVVICTPPRQHTELVLAALKSGCHVLCEKPLTLDLAELAELEAAARQTGRTLVTVHNWKYAPILARATELLGSGAIGKIQSIDWQVDRTSGSGGGLTAWRQEGGQGTGGILVDHGWHAFYLVLGWAGRAPLSLKASLQMGSGGVDEEAEVLLRLPGLEARIFLTWRAAGRGNRGRLKGDRGELRLEDDRLVLAQAGGGEEIQTFPAKLSAGSHHPTWMAGVFEEFREEIAHQDLWGRNFREAAWCARLIDLAYRSHATGGRWLDIPSP